MNLKSAIGTIITTIFDVFSDEENPDEPHYDPVHIGAMLVLVFFSLTIIFWLLWSILVFGGGIQSKVIPIIEVIFTDKTLKDFGYIGYPYEMGIFEGWITNVIALIFAIFLTFCFIYVYNKKPAFFLKENDMTKE